ncbi:MAG TPA: DUF1292 domain-containing protein [Bacillaceae bacterium]|nr:DUF1292 domain-containing protein [Bacillaceae bacterium]
MSEEREQHSHHELTFTFRLDADNFEDVLTLVDEEGNERQYEVISQFHVDETGKDYILLVPQDAEEAEDEDQQEVLAFRYEENEDGLVLYPIEDEAEWAVVEEAFDTLMSLEEE